MTTWHDKLVTSADDLRHVQFQLINLARAFERVGNNTVADELFAHADVINKVHDLIDTASGDVCHEMTQSGWTNTTNLYRAVVAGIQLAKDE